MDRYILTPYFLDQALPQIEELAQPKWTLNNPQLPEGDAQSRMSVLHKGLADIVEETVASGERPVSIVGDCCVDCTFCFA